MKNYIGLATSEHDPSIAIINKHGELVYAEGAERQLQSKRAWGCAPDHINYIEELVSKYCDPSVDTVVGVTWPKGISSVLSNALREVNSNIRRASANSRQQMTILKYSLLLHKSVLDSATVGLEYALANALASKNNKIVRKYFKHHLTHAAAAAYASPYDNALCAVLDGSGDAGSVSAFEYRDGKLKQIDAVRAPSTSLGMFYGLICEICGFGFMKGEEWKVMGLAAYGKCDPRLYDLMRPLIKVSGVTLTAGQNSSKNYAALLDMRRRPDVPAIEYADVAATAQFVFTETVHQWLRNLYELKVSDTLILSGGCALNSSTNGTIIEDTPFKELFVNSAPADDGNAIGAAYQVFLAENPEFKHGDGVLSPFLGSTIKRSSLDRLRRYCGFRSEELDDETLCRAVAAALSEGKIVGWAQGRAEFGPRALGNRSILADPRSPGVKEKINAEVKFREEFRPFAPSILHEHGEDYFHNYQFSPYMERTLRFKESVKMMVPGVVHVDGTGRLQSVTGKLNRRYYQLIRAFYDITGIPLVLNTSFNVMGKPIIHSVEDAIGVFQTTGLDLLVIDNTVFVKDHAYQIAQGGHRFRKAAALETSVPHFDLEPKPSRIDV